MLTDSEGKRRQCTTDEKIEVIKLHAEGHSYREIEQKTPVSRAQARKIVSDFDKYGTVDRPRRPGRPPKLDERDKRHLARLVEQAPDATLAEITADSYLDVCSKTVGEVCTISPQKAMKNVIWNQLFVPRGPQQCSGEHIHIGGIFLLPVRKRTEEEKTSTID
jgi:hypothetical protein